MDTRRDLALALAVACLGLAILVMTGSIRTGIARDVIGPRAFPYAIGALLLLGGMALAARRFRNMNRSGHFQAPEEGTPDNPDHPASARRAGLVMAISVVYAVLLMPLGYLITTPVFVASAFLVMNERRRLYTVVIPLVWTVSTYLLFSQLLNVRIPVGPFAPVFRELGLIVL
jgi:putative tricarboxylic transport membrane protein